jgi:hypothetical protein
MAREGRAPQAEAVAAGRVQMQFRRDAGVHVVHRVILGLEQEGRRRVGAQLMRDP